METTPQTGLMARWHHTPLYVRILGAMVLGVGVGLLLGARPEFMGISSKAVLEGFAIPSKLVLRVLGALAPALILLAITRALISAKFEPRLFRLLVLNTLVAILVGLLVANVVRPGHWTKLDTPPPAGAGHAGGGKPDMLSQFLENVPQSVLGPLTDNGKVIGVIFLAVAFGVAFRRSAQRPLRNIVDWLDLGVETLIVILHWIIDLVPLAVFGLVASIVGTKGFGAFHALGVFVIAVIVALILQAAYYLIRIRLGSWVSPVRLLRETRDALFMAFSTGSSTITMPVTYECLRKRVGLREKSASLGSLVGSNFNNDGTALYEAMAALFIAQGLGMELSLGQQLMVILTSVVASVGAAGIPEAGLVTMTLVFNAVGLPPHFIALLLPVDWFLDRCRTVINVMGDMNVACILDGHTPEKAEAAGT
jgi:Na+/H+-dicarboxylate symporter